MKTYKFKAEQLQDATDFLQAFTPNKCVITFEMEKEIQCTLETVAEMEEIITYMKMQPEYTLMVDSLKQVHPAVGIKFARQCSCCEKGMNAGYCINGGEKYYCSDICLSMNYDNSEIEDMGIGDDDSESYWTEWETEEDAQFIEINGVLTEIEE